MMIEETAEEYLGRIPMWTKKKNSLEDIRSFLEEMGSPDDSLKFIHVAGTNGKGSVCAFLASVLRQAGYHVGIFTSPHLEDVRERFRVDERLISKEELEVEYLKIRALSKRMTERGFCHPSYFEFLFFMGIDWFAETKPDFVILETGLGGRLDTTNVIRKPVVTVITAISLDHMAYLGDTIKKIAWEKAGIIKPGTSVIYDGNDETAGEVIEEMAGKQKSLPYPVDKSRFRVITYETAGILADLESIDGSSLEVSISSTAEYQTMNALLAFRTIEVLNRIGKTTVKKESIQAGLKSMRWPGRMEEALPGVYLDGAHNPGGIWAFSMTAERLCREQKKRAYLLFAAVSDKEHGTMIQDLVTMIPLDEVVVAHIDSERGTDIDTLKKEFTKTLNCPVLGFQTVDEALWSFLSLRDEGHLLFCVGSLYLIGEIKTILRRHEYDRFRR